MSSRSIFWCRVSVLIVAVTYTHTAIHGDVPPAISEVKLERAISSTEIWYRENNYLELILNISHKYEYPINIEFRIRKNSEPLKEAELVTFKIRKNESLASCIQRIENIATPEGYRHITIRGQHLFVSDGNEMKSPMEIPISLTLEQATTWEALKAWIVAVNEALQESHVELSIPNAQLDGTHKPPPDSFSDDPIQSINLESVTAREALCAIIENAPTSFSFSFSWSQSQKRYLIQISFPENWSWSEGDRQITEEEATWWREEMRQVRASY